MAIAEPPLEQVDEVMKLPDMAGWPSWTRKLSNDHGDVALTDNVEEAYHAAGDISLVS